MLPMEHHMNIGALEASGSTIAHLGHHMSFGLLFLCALPCGRVCCGVTLARRLPLMLSIREHNYGPPNFCSTTRVDVSLWLITLPRVRILLELEYPH